MENNYGLLLVWLFPMLGGIIGFILGKKNKSTRNDWIDIVMFVECVMFACMGYEIAREWSVLSLSFDDAFGFGLFFTIDKIRLLLCIMTVTVFGIVSQFMKESMKKEEGSNRFYLLYMCLFSMVLGVFLTPNFFDFFFFMTFAMLFAYPLIIHRPDKTALKNANIYLAFTIAGVVVIMIGLVMILGYMGSVSVDYIGLPIYSTTLLNGGSKGIILGGCFMFLGFAIFAGLFPVQLQVTRGNSYGLIEVSSVLASVVSKLGIFGILMLGANLFLNNSIFGKILLVIGIATVIWGLLITFTATDIRKILMGLDVAVNGFNAVSISLMVLGGESNAYAIRSSLYVLVVSSVSLMVLYMVALELVRKIKTYEIKGLIASGKDNKLLAVACLLACASLGGVPGTAGFLAYSLLYKSILTIAGWKWLLVVYTIQWAFLMTALARIFMKLFVSKKDETIRILTTEAELQTQAEKQNQNVDGETSIQHPYRLGEILLVLTGLVQILFGVVPSYTVDKLSTAISEFFHGKELVDSISYYTADVLVGFAVAVILCVLLYLNLVHGVLLRAIRNKKNRSLQEKKEKQESI